MFHKEGFKIILIAFAITTISFLLIDKFITISWLQKLIQIIILVLFILILQFFRNPKRNTIHNQNHALSPVDGKVVVIEEVFENEFFKDKRIQVSVFMSPLNVHVTRHPIAGNIEFSKYHPGKFLVAWHGFIKFGSRVDVFLPLDAKIKVKLNQKVRGGESIIAEV